MSKYGRTPRSGRISSIDHPDESSSPLPGGKRYVTLYFPGTNKIDYEGYVNSAGKRHGTGTSYWRGNGKKMYEGEWEEGKYNGQGILYDSTGRKAYEGQFLRGKKNGHGTEFGWDSEVKVYVGQFKDQDRCGQGMEFDPVTGLKIYQGEYKDGSRHGDGIKYEYMGGVLHRRIEQTYENGVLLKKNPIIEGPELGSDTYGTGGYLGGYSSGLSSSLSTNIGSTLQASRERRDSDTTVLGSSLSETKLSSEIPKLADRIAAYESAIASSNKTHSREKTIERERSNSFKGEKLSFERVPVDSSGTTTTAAAAAAAATATTTTDTAHTSTTTTATTTTSTTTTTTSTTSTTTTTTSSSSLSTSFITSTTYTPSSTLTASLTGSSYSSYLRPSYADTGLSAEERRRYEETIEDLREQLEKERKQHLEDVTKLTEKHTMELAAQEKQLLTTMWKINFNDVKIIGQRIGIGGFAEVFRGEYRGTPVALKVLLRQNLKGKKLQHFLDEVAILSKLRHPNVLLFIGASVEVKYSIATEFMEGGDLMRLLKNDEIEISYEQKIKFARDIARAMNYLHTSDPIVIHRDLKSENVLLDKHWNCKISDFGLTKIKDNDTFSDCGTPQWMAPEMRRGERYDEKVDVYAFGVLLWEIYTRKKPKLVSEHQRQVIPVDCPPAYARLISDCWSASPSKRPTFEAILSRIDNLMEEAIKSNGGESSSTAGHQ